MIGEILQANVLEEHCCIAAKPPELFLGISVAACVKALGPSGDGDGQSLCSAHLHAVYARNAAFFDPNIWFNEDEMRKQVEQLNGCCILTGQETANP